MDKLKALFNRDHIYTVTYPHTYYGQVTFAYFGTVHLWPREEHPDGFLQFNNKWRHIVETKLLSRMYKQRCDSDSLMDVWFSPCVLNPPQPGSKYLERDPKVKPKTSTRDEQTFFKHMRAHPQWWREDLEPDATNISVPVIVLD